MNEYTAITFQASECYINVKSVSERGKCQHWVKVYGNDEERTLSLSACLVKKKGTTKFKVSNSN